MARSVAGDAASAADGIATLDALGRTRALTDEESQLLERLIKRQSAAAPSQGREPLRRRSRKEPPSIEQRLQSTLESMRADWMAPRAIYLAPQDLAAAAEKGLREEFDGVPIRPAKGRGRSCIYSKQGVARALGQRGAGALTYPFITSSSPAGSVESPAGGENDAR